MYKSVLYFSGYIIHNNELSDSVAVRINCIKQNGYMCERTRLNVITYKSNMFAQYSKVTRQNVKTLIQQCMFTQ